jgi:hypothetical protein
LEWEGYVPAYIPPGFEINSYEDYKTAKSIYYSNGQGQTIRFTQYKSNDIDLWLDTEKAATENIMLNATEAFLIDKDGLISIVWAEDVTFCILGEGSKEELIKMAKSVNKKNFFSTFYTNYGTMEHNWYVLKGYVYRMKTVGRLM